MKGNKALLPGLNRIEEMNDRSHALRSFYRHEIKSMSNIKINYE